MLLRSCAKSPGVRGRQESEVMGSRVVGLRGNGVMVVEMSGMVGGQEDMGMWSDRDRVMRTWGKAEGDRARG